MSRVVIDRTLREKLGDLRESIELVDESGRTVGIVLSDERYRSLLPDDADEHLSREELDRLRGEPTYSTAEVLDSLRSL